MSNSSRAPLDGVRVLEVGVPVCEAGFADDEIDALLAATATADAERAS